jgi:hypothetical protein
LQQFQSIVLRLLPVVAFMAFVIIMHLAVVLAVLESISQDHVFQKFI